MKGTSLNVGWIVWTFFLEFSPDTWLYALFASKYFYVLPGTSLPWLRDQFCHRTLQQNYMAVSSSRSMSRSDAFLRKFHRRIIKVFIHIPIFFVMGVVCWGFRRLHVITEILKQIEFNFYENFLNLTHMGSIVTRNLQNLFQIRLKNDPQVQPVTFLPMCNVLLVKFLYFLQTLLLFVLLTSLMRRLLFSYIFCALPGLKCKNQ